MKWFLLAYTFITTFALTNSLHIPYNIIRCNKNKFQIKSREVKKEYKIAENISHPIQNMTGFYGLIGPDIDKFTINNLYDLITGDGLIQGVFFDNGTFTFVNHFVRNRQIKIRRKTRQVSQNNSL